jgi:hexulose-6-phosphate isomerase
MTNSTRRNFLSNVAAGSISALVVRPTLAQTQTEESESLSVSEFKPSIYTSVKWGMIGTKGSVLEKFQMQKELGYDGMEMDSPTKVDLDEAVAASKATNMPIHGVVDSIHWQQRLSSPDPKVRKVGREALEQAIKDTSKLGGSSVLLVPGRVTNEESHDDVWKRSIVEIREVIPTAARLGIHILIENVWNGFCETAEQMRDYIDEIACPWVGVYFDIGNVRKFSPSENWIRTLKHRIVKLDIKDWSKANGFRSKIGEGDVNWPEVRKALQEIRFSGWCTAEVGGGGRDRLADIASRIDKHVRS